MSWYEPDEGLGPGQERRLVELAQLKAADDPAFAFPDGARVSDIELEDAENPDGGWAFIARYGGREVTVYLPIDALDPSDDY
jgi:hypothetical protein